MNTHNKNIFTKFKEGFKKTSSQISSVLTGNKISEDIWEELEEKLITSDIGFALVEQLLNNVKKHRSALKTPQSLADALKKEAVALFPSPAASLTIEKPFVTLVIGVNGAGKTTTIAKFSKSHKDMGEKVLLCAADTFRAAAIEQLQSWGSKTGIDVYAPQEGTDPAAAAFEGVSQAIAKKYDRVVVDTAGRLHTKHNLMEELKKIYRVINKAKEGAPNEVILVLDGTTGQNAMNQAKVFNEAIPVTALAITKLDGTAKGGIVLNIAHDLKLPVKYVGFGEKENDLMEFNPEAYVDAIFSI